MLQVTHQKNVIIRACHPHCPRLGSFSLVCYGLEGHCLGSTAMELRVTLMARMVREGITILVADDDPVMLQVTSMILHRSGYKVLTAQDGEAALRTFEEAQHPIQLVISDVVMPCMMGRNLFVLSRIFPNQRPRFLCQGRGRLRPTLISLPLRNPSRGRRSLAK
jgi:CheY-like chemotaxis protein